jgi:mRNA interferase MazF
MMLFEAGDLVLLTFPFTGEAGSKQRPALVLFDAGDDDILVARVTTQRHTSRFDSGIQDWSAAGLLAPSTVRLHKLATVEKRLVRRKLGRLPEAEWLIVRSLWKQILGDTISPST